MSNPKVSFFSFVPAFCLLTVACGHGLRKSPTLPPLFGSSSVCQQLAQELQGLPPVEDPSVLSKGVVALLTANDKSLLRSDGIKPSERVSRKKLILQLRDEFHADEELLKAVAALNNPTLYRFGNTALYMVESLNGTRRCQQFVFFKKTPSGVQRLDPPPAIAKADEASFCDNSTGYALTTSGVPAFVIEQGDNQLKQLEIATWNEKWEKPCHTKISFIMELTAPNRFCKGVDCKSFASMALGKTKEFYQDPKAFRTLMDKQRQQSNTDYKFARLLRLAEKVGWDFELPTFGQPIDKSYLSFNADQVRFPLTVEGKTYLALLSSATTGVHISPDFIFAAYDLVNDLLEPVAGVYIEKRAIKIDRVQAD